uniref:RNase H type-1 domain-containing protein n=1 Tax=Setaria italica TaxID=4555 RepID=K3ZD24_SETIT
MVLEADCLRVIEMLKLGGVNRFLVAPVIMDALHESQQLQSLYFVKVKREKNKIAHELAHLAQRANQYCVSFSHVPECVYMLVHS